MQVQKYKPYRNKRILEAAKGEACTWCGIEDGTVVAAHSNSGSDGKGVGKKSDDCFVAFLCAEHHKQYDLKLWRIVYDLESDARREYLFGQSLFELCMKRTWKRLLEKGVLK
jgi:hypothetical protein